jgi:hypothetical protein
MVYRADFYKKQNKEDFLEAYESILQSLTKIRMIDHDFSPSKDITKEIKGIIEEDISKEEKQKKYDELLKDKNKEIEKVIRISIQDIFTIKSILSGVLFGSSGDKYDTISNLGQILSGSEHDNIKKLNFILSNFDDIYSLLNDLYDIDLKSYHGG